MKKQRIITAILTAILCVCFLSAASGATVVTEAYYENLRTRLAPEEPEPITFPDEELACYQTIRVGDTGEHVLKLKDRMYALGYFKNPSKNGTYTSQTSECVMAFQELNGLEATGVATPEMQALLYSEYALPGPNSSRYVEDHPDLEITYGKIIMMKSGGGGLQLNIENHTDKIIDIYYVVAIPFAEDGVPCEMADTLEEQIALCYFVEDYDLNSGSKLYSINRRLAFVLSEKTYYRNVIAAVIAYVTADGEVVDLYSPDSLWYGCGKAVPNGPHTQEGNTAVTYPTEEELAAAESWSLGTAYLHIPAVYRDYYDVPEGVYLYNIMPDFPAAVAGLRDGDILIALGDVVTNCEASLKAATGRIAEGEKARALYWRDGMFYLTTVIR